MISIDEVMPLLVEASPTFASTWHDFRAEWQAEAALPYYLVLGDYVRHMSALMAAGDSATLSKIFEIIERLHLEGDHEVRTAASVGLLEDLQNENMHQGTTPEQFQPLLHPTSRRFWDKVRAFWEKGEIITDD